MEIRVLDGDKRRMVLEEELLKSHDGRDEDGYNHWGYDREGRDRRGFDYLGIHSETNDYFDREGLDEYGFDREGKGGNVLLFEWEGCCEFSSTGIHKLTRTRFNTLGLDWNGCDESGAFIGDGHCLKFSKQIQKMKKKLEEIGSEIKEINAWSLEERIAIERQHLLKELDTLNPKEDKTAEIEDLFREIETIQEEIKKNSPPSKFLLKRPERKEKKKKLDDLGVELIIKKYQLKNLQDYGYIDEELINLKKNLESRLDSLRTNPEHYFFWEIRENENRIIDLFDTYKKLLKDYQESKKLFIEMQEEVKKKIQTYFITKN